MRKLDRGQAPACLNNYSHGKNAWNDVSIKDKEEIWRQLEDMQRMFCAYCECRINLEKNNRHIEHFFRRHANPKMTFDWINLFGSCKEPNSCGCYKDNKASSNIDLYKVCKPDTMNPADYLLFVKNGNVVPKEGLSDSDLEIAQNTISLFNLNGNSKLVGKRRAAARRESQNAEEYYQVVLQWKGKADPEMDALLDKQLTDNLENLSSG